MGDNMLNTNYYRHLLFLYLAGILLFCIECEKTPTFPAPITADEISQIPFDKLCGKIVFRRLLNKRPDEYFFILLDAEKQTLKDVGYFCPNVPTNLALSPQSDRILFSYFVLKADFQTLLWQMYVMNLEDEKIQNVTSSYFDDSYGAWTPDGRKISFWSNRNMLSAIWLVDLEQDSSFFLKKVAEIARTRCAWFPDGNRLIMADSDSCGNAELLIFNPETKTTESLIKSNLAANAVVYKHLCLSIDGSNLLFVKSFAAGYDGIWLLNLISKESSQVTTGFFDWHPSWSPNMDEILFSRGNHLYIIKPDGTELAQVTFAASTDEFPSWVP